MKIATINQYATITRITYDDKTYYYGDEISGVRNGYGKHCKADSTIIEAGFWEDDKCIEKLADDEIETILKDMY